MLVLPVIAYGKGLIAETAESRPMEREIVVRKALSFSI
jgi:hypothetical protein